VTALHEAVIRGDLQAIREAATAVLAYEPSVMSPDKGELYRAAIRQAAGRAASADSVQRAAFATASMLSACGECHQASGITPAVRLPRGSDIGGVAGHMREHERAADLMLQGLMVPSSALWRDGAGAFLAAPLRPEKLPDDPVLTPEIRALEARLHRAASDAVQAVDSLARANAYGLILAHCADCHSVHRKVVGPPLH
jgi:cytochrome c553